MKQCVFQIASGYEDANDSDELKNDPISQRVTETAGIYNTVGFNNDTRSFPSIPVRHDLSRRIDSNFLGRLVAQHIIDMEDARKMSQALTYDLVKKAYKL